MDSDEAIVISSDEDERKRKSSRPRKDVFKGRLADFTPSQIKRPRKKLIPVDKIKVESSDTDTEVVLKTDNRFSSSSSNLSDTREDAVLQEMIHDSDNSTSTHGDISETCQDSSPVIDDFSDDEKSHSETKEQKQFHDLTNVFDDRNVSPDIDFVGLSPILSAHSSPSSASLPHSEQSSFHFDDSQQGNIAANPLPNVPDTSTDSNDSGRVTG